MITVTLSKALNIKNKLVGEKNKLIQILYKCNSRKDNAKINYDVREVLDTYNRTIDKIIAVKTALSKANVEIYEKIYTIAELRSKIAELSNMPTREDEEKRRVGYTETYEIEKWVSTYTDADVAKMVADMENQIDKLQDEIDTFNHAQKIEIQD